MIDGHVHLEQGMYCKEWIDKFIQVALTRGVSEVLFLEHSHRFTELKPIYCSIANHNLYGDMQKKWLDRKSQISINEYKSFIEEMRKFEFPIVVKFGLEVCYFPDKNEEIKTILSDFEWDFLTGAIHWIDGWGFDHPKTRATWESQNTNAVYLRYYNIMKELISSNIFDIVAYPDSIKCFNYFPTIDLGKVYDEIIIAAKENGKIAFEQSAGLSNNYNHKEIGLNYKFLTKLKNNKIPLITASDAHRPEDTGKGIKEIELTLL